MDWKNNCLIALNQWGKARSSKRHFPVADGHGTSLNTLDLFLMTRLTADICFENLDNYMRQSQSGSALLEPLKHQRKISWQHAQIFIGRKDHFHIMLKSFIIKCNKSIDTMDTAVKHMSCLTYVREYIDHYLQRTHATSYRFERLFEYVVSHDSRPKICFLRITKEESGTHDIEICATALESKLFYWVWQTACFK